MTERPSGFTLLEVLVALAVFGFVLLEIKQGADFGLRAFAMQSRLIERRADLDGVDRTLRGLVARMDPGSQTDPPQLRGNHAAFSFTTDLPAGVGDGVYRHVDVTLAVNAAHRLVMRWTPHLHVRERGASPAFSEATLLAGMDAIRFDYLYPSGSGGVGWSEAWAGSYLPRLVRIQLDFPKGGGLYWPDIVAEPAQDRPRD